MSYMEELRQLTDKLISAEPDKNSKCIEAKMDKGTGLGWNLMYEDRIAISRWFNSGGSRFPPHEHHEKTVVIIYDGEMDLDFDSKLVQLKKGDTYYLNSGTKHQAYFPVDTWYIAISMPSNPRWPR